MRSTLGSALRASVLLALAAGCIDVELDASAVVLSTLAPADEEELFAFDGAEGDALLVRVTSGKAAPIDFSVTLYDDGAGVVGFEGVPGVADAPGSWSVSGFTLPKTGRFTLDVSGDRAGDYQLQLKVGKGSKSVQRLDLRAVTLGMPAGWETAYSRTVGTDGGVVEVENDRDLLVGARIDVPAGALRSAARILITSAPLPGIPDALHQRAAGPAVRIGPPLRLAAAATVTIPYRTEDVPVGTSPSALRVLFVDSRGKSSVLTPVSVDDKDETLSVTTARLGTFVAVVSRGAPELSGRRYWESAFSTNLVPDAGADSRVRTVWAIQGIRSFGSGGALSFRQYSTFLEWTHDDQGLAAVTADVAPMDTGDLVWQLAGDGRTVAVSNAGTELYGLTPSDDASVLVPHLTGGAGDASAWIGVSAEIDVAEPTPAYVAGTYWTAALVLSAAKSGDPAPLMLELGRQLGTLTIRADGTWTSSVDYHAGRSDGDSPAEFVGGSSKSAGTWEFVTSDENREFAGSLRLRDGNGVPVIGSGLRFGAKGRVFVAMQEPDAQGMPLVWAVGIRKEKGAGAGMLSGEYGGSHYEFSQARYEVPGRTAVDLGLYMESMTFEFANRTAAVQPGAIRRSVSRDPASPGGVLVDFSEYEGHPPARCALQKTGKLTISPPSSKLVGATTADCRFGFHVSMSSDPLGGFGVALFVRSAP